MYSKEEENWFKKFQEGTLLAKGWKSRVKEIIKPFRSPERERLQQELEILGEQIGREWSKDNSIRKIDTKMLQNWGESLVAAKDRGADSLIDEIQEIRVNVDKLIS